MTINRFCASGLQAIALATNNINAGMYQVVIAGGTESMSLIPMEGHNFSPNPTLVEEDPDVYLSMGLTAENLADQYQVPREKQDEFSFGSHQKALDAQAAGRFEEELIPLQVNLEELKEGHKQSQVVEFKVDEGPRADTSLEALAQLKPVFQSGRDCHRGKQQPAKATELQEWW